MYERFTDRARKVMQLANQEAQRFGHEYIGTEHILLGLSKEGSGGRGLATQGGADACPIGIKLRNPAMRVTTGQAEGPAIRPAQGTALGDSGALANLTARRAKASPRGFRRMVGPLARSCDSLAPFSPQGVALGWVNGSSFGAKFLNLMRMGRRCRLPWATAFRPCGTAGNCGWSGEILRCAQDDACLVVFACFPTQSRSTRKLTASRFSPFSSPLGVSRYMGTLRNLRSDSSRRKGSMPRWPRPMCS
jgi:hypothetical protein